MGTSLLFCTGGFGHTRNGVSASISKGVALRTRNVASPRARKEDPIVPAAVCDGDNRHRKYQKNRYLPRTAA
jgi:hypothetical protein